MNHAPKSMVISKEVQASSPFPSRKLWWDQVKEAPEDRSTAVLRSGTPQGFIDWTPVGGHLIPISGVGDRAL